MADHGAGGHQAAVAEVGVHGAKGVGSDHRAVRWEVDAVQAQASEPHRAQAHGGNWIDADALVPSLDQEGQDVARLLVLRIDEECVREDGSADERFGPVQPPAAIDLTCGGQVVERVAALIGRRGTDKEAGRHPGGIALGQIWPAGS